MDCHSFEQRLEDFLDRKLGAEQRRGVEQHLDQCRRCRELVAMLDQPIPAPPDLARAVLEKTSGPTCDRARSCLCDHVDGRLSGVPAELVRVHLGACEECGALARTLVRLGIDLPQLAAMQPDERFVRDVLTRTLPLRVRWNRWAARVSARWQRLLQRPRFAWESAYVLTVLLALLVGVPNWPVAAASKRAHEMATVELPRRVQKPVAQVGAEVSTQARNAWQSTTARAEATADDVARFSSALITKIETEAGTFWSRFASGQTEPVDTEERSEGPPGKQKDNDRSSDEADRHRYEGDER